VAGEKGVGIPEPDPEGQRIGLRLLPLPARARLRLHQGRRVGRDLAHQQVCRMRLRDDADRLALGRRGVAQRGQFGLPDLVQRGLAAAGGDEAIGRLVEAVVAAGAGVGQHMPDLAAHHLARDTHTLAQPQAQAGDAVPVG
jgi:hypothetical protein